MANTNDKLSRRALLGGAAVASTGAVLSACGGTDSPAGPNPDILPLNALLSAEYTAIKAYDAGIPILMMPPAGDALATQGLVVAAVAQRWQQQHRDHAAALVTAIQSIGGTPVLASAITYAPPQGFTPGVANVMKLAANAEKGAAIAYTNTIKLLSSTGHRFLAGTIEGDETQHFIVLYTLLKQLAGPGAGIVTGVSNIVPVSFVAAPTGSAADHTNSLEGVADLAYGTT